MKRTLRLAGNLCFLALLLLIVLTATDYLKQQVLGVQTSDVSLKLWIGGVFLCAAGLVCLSARRKWPPELCFLLAFVPMALVFWVCVPLFQVPDEGLHAVRASPCPTARSINASCSSPPASATTPRFR